MKKDITISDNQEILFYKDGNNEVKVEERSVVSILETTASDGKSYKIKHYNL